MTDQLTGQHPEQMIDQGATAPLEDGRADFDFFIGSWTSQQRKLKRWLQGCDEWEEFVGHSTANKLLGGLGNMDEVRMETAAGPVIGVTVRLFDPTTRLWRIYWVDSVHGSALGEPMVGRFVDGRGEFYDSEVFQGHNVFSRFIWTSSDHDHCHWEQAFSEDAGRSWETNWTADFTRAPEREE